jgi:DNA-binding transcriptional LysR family regulator
MNIRQLEAFRATMMAQTTIGAAELLGVSQPAISRLLTQLEASLRLTLFDRTSGRLQPTPEAKLLYEEVQRTFVSVDKIREIAREMQLAKTGMVSLAALPALANGFVPTAIGHFVRNRPESRISLRMQMSTRIEELVAAQIVDFGLAEYPFQRAGVEVEEFCSVSLMIAVPSTHRLAGQKSCSPKDLQGERFISLTHNNAGRRLADDIFMSAGVQRRLVLEAQIFSIVASMVSQDLGIGLIDPFTAFDFRDRGIVVIPFEPSVTLRIGLLHPVHRPTSRATREFISCLKTYRREVLSRF